MRGCIPAPATLSRGGQVGNAADMVSRRGGGGLERVKRRTWCSSWGGGVGKGRPGGGVGGGSNVEGVE